MGHARLHSAGHLLDSAIKHAGYTWIAKKGYHFAEGPYVEYELDLEAAADLKNQSTKDATIQNVQSSMNELLKAGGAVVIGSNDAGVRTITMTNHMAPCGGTHVKDMAELGDVNIKKLAVKKNMVKVSYSVSQG